MAVIKFISEMPYISGGKRAERLFFGILQPQSFVAYHQQDQDVNRRDGKETSSIRLSSSRFTTKLRIV